MPDNERKALTNDMRPAALEMKCRRLFRYPKAKVVLNAIPV